MMARMTALAARIGRASVSTSVVGVWFRGLSWTIASVGLERIISLVQTILIARYLGVEDYGRFGLIFSTIGLLASVAGIQLGTTATAYLARYRTTDPAAAGGVIVLTESLSFIIALVCVAVALIEPEQAAAWLLKDAAYAPVMLVAGMLVVLAVITGVQEGILQGFEAFRALAWVRVGLAVLTFIMIIAIGGDYGLHGILSVVVVGAALRFAVLMLIQKQLWRTAGLRYSWDAMWSMSRALIEFSIPAVIGNLLLGGALWYGTYLLSRSATGFDDVALASAAQQWRGPVLFLNSSLATVAIPLMSRPAESEGGGAHRIHRLNIWSNLAIAFASCAVIALASTPILMAYAPSFIEHRWAFLLIVASVIGQSHVQILFQLLTSMRRLWRVLYYQMLFIIPFAAGYEFVVPEWGLMGFAWLTFAIWTAAGVVLHAFISARIVRERRLV